MLKAWRGVFPDVIKPKSEISDALQEHLRYPEDLFKVQRELMARYHVSDPGIFFTNDAFWSVPNDPTAPEDQGLSQPPYFRAVGLHYADFEQVSDEEVVRILDDMQHVDTPAVRGRPRGAG